VAIDAWASNGEKLANGATTHNGVIPRTAVADLRRFIETEIGPSWASREIDDRRPGRVSALHHNNLIVATGPLSLIAAAPFGLHSDGANFGPTL
jgi:hypothetical protein